MKLVFYKSNVLFVQTPIALCLLALVSGCSDGNMMADNGSYDSRANAGEASDGEMPEQLGQSQQALTGPPQILSFIGDIPRFPTEGSQPAATLSIVFATSVGLKSNRVRGLNVCWYIPSNPDNSFTEGDTQDCTVIGDDTASFGAFQTCPADMVSKGYFAKEDPDDPSVDTFGLSCVSLTDPNDVFNFGEEGSSSALFSRLQLCNNSGYLSSINMNQNGLGMGGSCHAR
jgi:hypothetical protein